MFYKIHFDGSKTTIVFRKFALFDLILQTVTFLSLMIAILALILATQVASKPIGNGTYSISVQNEYIIIAAMILLTAVLLIPLVRLYRREAQTTHLDIIDQMVEINGIGSMKAEDLNSIAVARVLMDKSILLKTKGFAVVFQSLTEKAVIRMVYDKKQAHYLAIHLAAHFQVPIKPAIKVE